MMSMPTSTDTMAMSSTMGGGMHMGTATSSAMPMSSSSSSSSSSMGGMSGGMMNMMGMDQMAMTFFTSSMTPLFSMAWTPMSDGAYAGTCIFLIVFAACFRALLAFRAHFYIIIAAIDARRFGGLEYEPSNASTGGKSLYRPWKAREAVMIGSLDVVIAGVGYLLMIAVMTMNVGYFMSVLAGVFVGSVTVGRFIIPSPAH